MNFIETWILENAYVDGIELVSVNNEVINIDLSNNVKNIERISNHLDVKSWISIYSKVYYFEFELLSIKVKSLTGEFEELVYFNCIIHYESVKGNKILSLMSFIPSYLVILNPKFEIKKVECVKFNIHKYLKWDLLALVIN